MDNQKLSIGRIFFTDYAATLSTIAILISLGFYLFDRFVQSLALTKELPYIIGLVSIVGVAVILWRVRLISSAFEFGWEVEGDIVDVSFFRDRGRVTYVYTIQGERYQAGNAIMQNRMTKALYQGQRVVIMANKDNPKIAFIRDIYS